jgi:Flp pilus assembly protein TadD
MKKLWLCGIVAAALGLTGCAASGNGGRAGSTSLSPTPAGVPAAGRLSAQSETALYLDVIAGLEKQRRSGAALAFLDEYATREKSPAPRYWLLRGDAFLGLDRPADATVAYAHLDATPLAALGWNGQGRVAAIGQRWTDAAEKFRRAVSLDPSSADFLNNLGYAQMHLGQNAASAACLRQAHELAPDSALIRNNLIVALILKGDGDQANEVLGSITNIDQRRKVQAFVAKAVTRTGFEAEKRS